MDVKIDMQVYIMAEGETFQLPVNPFSISQDGGKKYETFDILYKGEVDFPSKKAKRIKTLTMNILLPEEYEPYCNYEDILKPSEIMDKIEKWANLEEPVRLLITEYNFNELAYISDYPESSNGNEQGDRRIDLSFRIVNEDEESEDTTETPKESPPLKSRPTESPKKSETVVKGDSLWKIAKKVYGDGSQYNKIYEANKGIIGSNPNLIHPGQKLIIPK